MMMIWGRGKEYQFSSFQKIFPINIKHAVLPVFLKSIPLLISLHFSGDSCIPLFPITAQLNPLRHVVCPQTVQFLSSDSLLVPLQWGVYTPLFTKMGLVTVPDDLHIAKSRQQV